jgi:RHS repeat-associated protein
LSGDIAESRSRRPHKKYDFELLSGNVKQVRYQEEEADQLTHRYRYDNMDRLRTVHTSSDGVHEEREAHYQYFDYGPLARVELGEHQVQASDYAYTINGWLKGSNSTILQPGYDTGRDGIKGYNSSNEAQHKNFGRDIAGYGLGYFGGDYKGIGSPHFEAAPGGAMAAAIKPLFNGNIAFTTTSIDGFADQSSVYSYDQLHRLTGMKAFDGLTGNTWTTSTELQAYKSTYSYDRNGNLQNLTRNADDGTLMDDLAYHYLPNTNKLDYVADASTYTNGEDLQNQAAFNYDYDLLGQLTDDVSEGLSLTWRLGDKKLASITHGASKPNAPNMDFVYNPFGQRILKIVKDRTNGIEEPEADWAYTYYSYDAGGAVSAVYELSNPQNVAGRAELKEQHLYGAGRLGMIQRHELIYDGGVPDPNVSGITGSILGDKRYEITNHLGNVNVVINDRKILSEYTPQIITFEEIEPQVALVGPAMNTWRMDNATGQTVTQDGNTAWKITRNAGFGGGNLLVEHEIGATYTVEFDVLEVATASATFLVRDHEHPIVPVLANITTPGHKSFTFVYNGLSTHARYKFQMDNVPGYIVIDNLSVSGPGMETQYPSIETYAAVPVMKADYYPFGVEMPGRKWQSDSYRYAYNGMEKDNEVKGNGNSYTTEFRQYDPRLGRWLSLDPLMMSFPWMSPYVAFDNNPVYYVDPYGLESGNKDGNGGASGGAGEDGSTSGGTSTSGCGAPPCGPTVTAPKSTSSQDYKNWLDNKGGGEFIREIRNQIYESKKSEGNMFGLGQIANGTNAAGNPDYDQEVLDLWDRQAEQGAIYAAHALYAEEMSGVDPTGLNYLLNPFASTRFELWLLDAASTESEASGIKTGLVIDAALAVLPIVKGVKMAAKTARRIKYVKFIKPRSRRALAGICFIAGTPIKIKEGEKSIEEVKVGDKVWSFDEQTGKIALMTVEDIMEFQSDHLDKLVIGLDTIYTTDEHPFWVSSGWKKASDLVVGDTLTLLNKERVILSYKQRIDTLVKVYNFTVDGYHTYYVGEQGVLVHNKPRPIRKIRVRDDIKYPGNDPTKAPDGFEWKGKPGSTPGSGPGNWYNPRTKESLHPDLNHPNPIGPHWDYKDGNGNWWRIFPNGSKVAK